MNYLQAAFFAVLHDNADIRGFIANSKKLYQVLMFELLHLEQL